MDLCMLLYLRYTIVFFALLLEKKRVRIADPLTYLQAMLNFISVEYETLPLAAYRHQR